MKEILSQGLPETSCQRRILLRWPECMAAKEIRLEGQRCQATTCLAAELNRQQRKTTHRARSHGREGASAPKGSRIQAASQKILLRWPGFMTAGEIPLQGLGFISPDVPISSRLVGRQPGRLAILPVHENFTPGEA